MTTAAYTYGAAEPRFGRRYGCLREYCHSARGGRGRWLNPLGAAAVYLYATVAPLKGHLKSKRLASVRKDAEARTAVGCCRISGSVCGGAWPL
jgi:hypothetical protein